MRVRSVASCIAVFAFSAMNLNAGVITEFTNEASFQASTSALTDIDFDAFTGGDTLTGSEFVAQGLTIIHRDSQQLQILDSSFGFTQFHNLNINSSPSGLGSGGDTENIDFTLSSGSLAAGLWIGNIADIDGSNNPVFDDDSNGTLVQFVGVSGSVLAEEFLRTDTAGMIQGPASPNNRIFYGISYSGSLVGIDPIKTIRIVEGSGDADGVVFDNVQFSTSSVPEPSSTLLFTIAFAGLAARRLVCVRWRRRSADRTIRPLTSRDEPTLKGLFQDAR